MNESIDHRGFSSISFPIGSRIDLFDGTTSRINYRGLRRRMDFDTVSALWHSMGMLEHRNIEFWPDQTSLLGAYGLIFPYQAVGKQNPCFSWISLFSTGCSNFGTYCWVTLVKDHPSSFLCDYDYDLRRLVSSVDGVCPRWFVFASFSVENGLRCIEIDLPKWTCWNIPPASLR